MTTTDRLVASAALGAKTATPKVTRDQAKTLKIARKLARRNAELLRRLA